MNMTTLKKNGQCFANKSVGLVLGITNIKNGRGLSCHAQIVELLTIIFLENTMTKILENKNAQTVMRISKTCMKNT